MASPGYGTFLNEKVEQQLLERRRVRARRTSRSLEDWMSLVDDDKFVSGLSIPGTHDSAAFGSIWPFVSTQTMDILQQLNAGIRYFDLRCGLRNEVVEMVHGRALLGLKLEEVLKTMYVWLDAHPREGLVVQIKQDRAPEESESPFPNAIFSVLDVHPQYWRTLPTTPIMSELRGKIQLFRRFSGPFYRGIGVSRWQDNPTKPFTIHTFAGVEVTIQDHYSTEPLPLPDFISRKGGDVSDLLRKSVLDKDMSHWYINFASAYQFNFWHRVTPREVALGGWYDFRWIAGINPMLLVYLKEQASKRHRHRYGIVAMDFPDAPVVKDLIKCIVESNFAEKKKKKSAPWWQHPISYVALFLLLLYLGGIVLLYVHGPVERSWCPPYNLACALHPST